jgi:hypothetical protein
MEAADLMVRFVATVDARPTDEFPSPEQSKK